jgi:hypothetical protein
MEKEVEVGGNTYKIGTLSAITQFQIVRRLGPLVADLLAARSGAESEKADGTTFLENIAPKLASSLAGLSDEATEYVLYGCLSVVSRKVGPAWAPTLSKNGKQLMYQDIDLMGMIQLVTAVLEDSLSSFFSSPAPKSEIAQ